MMCTAKTTSKNCTVAITGRILLNRPAQVPVLLGGGSERRRVLAEYVLHRAAHLAKRGTVLQRLADGGQQVIGAPCSLAQLIQALVHELLVAVGLERLQPSDLFAL